MEKTPIIDCITHLLLMTLHSECCLIGRYPIWFTNLPMPSSANLIFILSTICGTRAVDAISCVQKSKKHFKIESLMRDYHFSLHTLGKVQTNPPRASQICIGVFIVLSIKTQSLCDVLIGQELK